MNTRPLTPWSARDPMSARHLNEVWGETRSNRISVPGANVSRFPNGTGVEIPEAFIPPYGLPGCVTDTGPGGEADFTHEQYWIRLQYYVADKWGNPMDIAADNPVNSSDDLSDIIIPATNICERTPGGPVNTGTHVLTVGFPVLLLPERGRATTPTDVTPVQRFVFYISSVGQPQYEGQVDQAVGNGQRAWKMFTTTYPLT